MVAKRSVGILLILVFTIIVATALFWFSYYSSRQNDYLNALVRVCSISAENFKDGSIWRNGSVLVYNKTIFAKGFIREKAVYVGKYYNIAVDNGTHITVYATSVGRFPIYSKGVFYEIHAIAIYRKEKDGDLRPAIIYSYRYAKNSYPHRKYYYFRPIRDEDEMIFETARFPLRPIHFWVKDFVRRGIMNVNIDHKEVMEMKLLKDYKINGRNIWIVRYSFLNESVDVYACIDVETQVMLAEVSVDKDQASIGYLENIIDVDSVPTELLSMIRNAEFVDISTNRTLEIPRP